MKKIVSLLIISAMLLSLFTGCGNASSNKPTGGNASTGDFPKKTIELAIPYPPGGATDGLARVLAKEASAFLPNGQSIIVSNKTNAASGTVGVADVLKSDSDGYTVGMAYTTSFTMAPYIVANVKYDYTDFDYLMTATTTLTYIQALKDSGIKTFEDFVKATKEGPNLTVGAMGISGPGSFGMSLMADKYGMKNYTIVPFKSSAEAWTGLAQKSVDINFVSADTEASDVNILAGVAPERSELFPDVPTLKELGYEIDNTDTHTVLFIKKDVPEDIKQLLYDAFSKAAKTDAFKLASKQFTTGYAPSDREGAKKVIEDEHSWIVDMVKEVGLYVNDPKK